MTAQRGRLDVPGRQRADVVFDHSLRGDDDAVVVHRDQVLAQLKTVAFDKPMNWTLNIPFIHTSPDHGTAYGGAGRGAANPSSMVAVIRLYRLLACGADQERLFCD